MYPSFDDAVRQRLKSVPKWGGTAHSHDWLNGTEYVVTAFSPQPVLESQIPNVLTIDGVVLDQSWNEVVCGYWASGRV